MNWERVKLGEVLPFKYGKGLPKRERNEDGLVPVYSSAGMTGKHDSALIDQPCIVIGRKGTIGSVYFVEDPSWPIDTVFYTLGTPSIDLRFGFYLLQTLPLSTMNNDSAVPGLNRAHAEDLDISIPEIAEQRRIAHVLGALDDKIESNQRQIFLAEQIILFRFNSSFDVAECEDGVLVSELIEVGPKRSFTKGGVAPYVGMTHLPEFSLSVGEWGEKEYSGGQRFINGDVLMARITPCLENGKTAIVDMLPPGQVGFGSTEYIVLAPRGNFSTAWIYGFVRNEHIREWAIKQMNGSSGRQRFPASAFGTYRIKSPHPDILKAFNQEAAGLLELCRVRRNENRRLAALRDTLLPELLSGRITPEQLEAGL